MVSAVPMSRSRGSISGLILVLLGAWGGLAPLIGPYFKFGFLPDQAWHYSTGRLYLSIVPGGVVLLAGLVISVTKGRWLGGTSALAAALGGAWFIMGQSALLVLTGSAYSVGSPVSGSTDRLLLTSLACFAGLGTLIVFFAALALGRQSIAAHRDHLKFGDLTVPVGPGGGLANVGLTPSSPSYEPYQATGYQQASFSQGGGSYEPPTNPQPVVGGQSQFPSQYPDPPEYGVSTNAYAPGPITYSPGQTRYPLAQEQTNPVTRPAE
jgi:hypothetical protein